MKRQVSLIDESAGITLFKGDADVEQLQSGGWIVSMETPEGMMTWKILKKGIIIENVQDLKTILQISDNGTGKVRIFSPYGEMETALEHPAVTRSRNKIVLNYQIPPDQMFQFRMEGGFLQSETE